ncbi:MAG: c-type cytochrome [Parvularculaceae bacterium]
MKFKRNLAAASFAGLFVIAQTASGLAATAKENFDWYCAQCHGFKGVGDGINSVDDLPVGPMNLTSGKEMSKYTGPMIVKTLTHGGPVNTLDSLMPPWGNRLTADEIEELMRYVQSLCKEAECSK